MTTNLMKKEPQKTDEIKQVSTFHPSLPKSIYPISKYRYQWKFSDQIEPNEKIITETETIGIFTVDFVYYEGDKDNLTLLRLLKSVRNQFEQRYLPHDFDFSRLRKTKTGYHKYDIHYTVTFNTCEKWGVCETQPYLEITKSSHWGNKRYDRSRSEVIFFVDRSEPSVFKPILGHPVNSRPKTYTTDFLISTKPKFSYSNVVNFNKKMDEVYKDDYSLSNQFKKDILDLSSIMLGLDEQLEHMKKNGSSWGEYELGNIECSYSDLKEKYKSMYEKLSDDFNRHQTYL